MVVFSYSYFVALLAVMCSVGEPTPRYSRTVSYEDDILVKCTGLKREEVDGLMVADGVDVWKIRSEGNVDFRVSKNIFKKMEKTFSGCKEAGSVEEIVRRAERMAIKKQANRTNAAEWFEEYHHYAEIVDWWRKLSEDYPEEVKFEESIGKSYEGRDQPAVTITSATTEANIIYFQCQIHAREWISAATCMYIANYLMDNKYTDLRVSRVLEQVKFIFVPFVNPDGYEYTWTNNRLWRKNRRPGSLCDGIDLNRNYNDHWAGGGSSSNPCSETYHGTSAESEPETQNTANYFRSLGNVVGAADWHSFGQLILRRYGWTMADCPDEARLKSLGDAMSVDIGNVNGKMYTSQKSSQLYTSTGTASDWFYSDDGNVNNDYRAAGYTIELRDTGQYGFELLPEEIIPTGEEMIPAVLRFVEELNENPLQK